MDADLVRRGDAEPPPIKLPGDAAPRRTWFQEFEVSAIQFNASNRQIYEPFDTANHDDRHLMNSIKTVGVMQPPIVFPNGTLLSGHRRTAACKCLKIESVLCQVIEAREDDDPDLIIRQLREFNVSRDKSIIERTREEIVDVNRDDAHARLAADRIERRTVAAEAMDLGDRKRRSKVGPRRRPFLTAVQAVVESLRDYWPISLRTIHYKLVSKEEPTIVDAREGTVYANDKKSSKKLSELATLARLAGELDLNAIEDETRSVSLWQTHQTVHHFIKDQTAEFLTRYQRNYLQTQPHWIEVVCEKLALKNVIEPVCGRYTLPLTIGRGHCSIPPRWEIVKRYKRSRKEKLILLVLGDFDPDGVVIAESFARTIRDDFNVPNVLAVRVALNADQIAEHKLPTSLEAKAESVNYKKFVKKYGTAAYELDALDPGALEDILRESIAQVLDVDAFNREVDAEKEDAAHLVATRRAIMKSIGNADLEGTP